MYHFGVIITTRCRFLEKLLPEQIPMHFVSLINTPGGQIGVGKMFAARYIETIPDLTVLQFYTLNFKE
jgi:hypothetical protein